MGFNVFIAYFLKLNNVIYIFIFIYDFFVVIIIVENNLIKRRLLENAFINLIAYIIKVVNYVKTFYTQFKIFLSFQEYIIKIDLIFIKRFKYYNINKNIARNRRGEVVINIYIINKRIRRIRDNVKKIKLYKINKERIKFEVREINKKINEIVFNIYTISFIIGILYKK